MIIMLILTIIGCTAAICFALYGIYLKIEKFIDEFKFTYACWRKVFESSKEQ